MSIGAVNQAPLFGCADCYEVQTFPASDLRVHDGKCWCNECWNVQREDDDRLPLFVDLPVFVPAHEARIAELEAQVRTAGADAEAIAEAQLIIFQRLHREFQRKLAAPEANPLDIASLTTADQVMAELFPQYTEARRLRGEGE